MKNKFLNSLLGKKSSLIRRIKARKNEIKKLWAKTSGSEIVRSRLFLAAVALAISLILWIFVAWDGNTEGTRTLDVPIQYINTPRGFTLFDSDGKVQVRVLGRVGLLSRAEVAEFRAEVDLQGLQAGKYKLPIRIEVPQYLRLRSWNPATAEVEIYRQIERALPVTWRLEGNPPGGKILGSVEISPAEVTLSGPEADVLAVQALEVVLPAGRLSGGAALKLPVKAADASQMSERVRISPASVSVKVSLEDKIIGEQIPVHVTVSGEPAEGLEVDSIKIVPDMITIKGGGEAVRAMGSLELSPIDVTGIDQNMQLMLPLQPGKPVAGIEIIGPDRARVEITVRKKMAAKTYSSIPVKIYGAAPGVEWRVVPQSASLTVEGSQAYIDSLFSWEPPCELYVDVSNIIVKQISLPVLVRKLQKNFEVIQITPEQVMVTVISDHN